MPSVRITGITNASGAVAIERIPLMMPPEWMEGIEGSFLTKEHYDDDKYFHNRAVNVLKPDNSLLLALRPGLVPGSLMWDLAPHLRGFASATTHRQVAAGGQKDFRSKTVGYLNGKLTSVTKQNREGWDLIQVLIRHMNRTFKEVCPEQFAAVRMATMGMQVVDDTVFTGAQVNWHDEHRKARMAVHKDDNNELGCYGAMTVVLSGDVEGGVLVFPRYRVGVSVQNGDFLVCDNQEAHGNTEIRCGKGGERISVVCYAHK